MEHELVEMAQATEVGYAPDVPMNGGPQFTTAECTGMMVVVAIVISYLSVRFFTRQRNPSFW